MIVALIAVLSFAGCSVLSVQEYLALNKSMESSAHKAVGQGKLSLEHMKERKPAPDNLLTLLPKTIDGYKLEAHQKIPGEDKFAAEAIYQQAKDERAIPYNSYVKVAYYGNQREAKRALDEIAALRYPSQAIAHERGSLVVHTSYDHEHSGFLIGSIINGYLLTVHTNYLHAASVEQEMQLETSGWEIFDNVSGKVSEVSKR